MSSSTDGKAPSNASFGALFTAIFAGLAAYGYWQGTSNAIALGCVGAGTSIGIITLFFPRLLTPFAKLWFRLGELLGRIVSPLVLGAMFFVVLTPVSLVTRMFGRDALRLRRKMVSSYWIDRHPPGPDTETFKNQF